MRLTFCKILAALLLSSGAHLVQASGTSLIADWQFNEPFATTLNLTANSGLGVDGPGSSWDVGLTGVATDGTGGLFMANDGKGGSGTRSTYADFGPAFAAPVSSGLLSVYTSFSAWARPSQPLSFTLAFIEGSSFSTAQFSFGASAGGFSLGASGDPLGDGGSLAPTTLFTGFQALTVRLDVDLDHHDFRLAYDSGSGFITLGGASVDSLTAGINSLRLSTEGDFGGNGLTVDRIWVLSTPVTAVPEVSSALMLLAGLGLMMALAHRRGFGRMKD